MKQKDDWISKNKKIIIQIKINMRNNFFFQKEIFNSFLLNKLADKFIEYILLEISYNIHRCYEYQSLWLQFLVTKNNQKSKFLIVLKPKGKWNFIYRTFKEIICK